MHVQITVSVRFRLVSLTMDDMSSDNESLRNKVACLEGELEAMTTGRNQQELIATQSSSLTKSLMIQVEQLQEQLKEAQTDRDKARDDVKRLAQMRQMIEGQFSEVAEQCQLLIDEKNRLQEENERLSGPAS